MTLEVERLAASELADLLPKVQNGERLGRADCLRLWRTYDLTSLGVLSNLARERVSGNSTFFRAALHINHTGRPAASCPECRDLVSAAAPPLRPEDIERIVKGIPAGEQGEVHLNGDANPESGVADLCLWVKYVREACPQLHLRAFTWQELAQAAIKDGKSPIQVLSALVDAGLTSLAGGALVDLTPDRPHLGQDCIGLMERRLPWIQAAASLELRCELCWIYGDADDPEVLTDTLLCIRGMQDHWGIFDCFAPWVFFWPRGNPDIPIPTDYNHLRSVAVGRLFLDNIPRIRSSPYVLSESITQVAQWYGADDTGSAKLGIGAALSAQEPALHLGRAEMVNLLRAAGRDPVEVAGR